MSPQAALAADILHHAEAAGKQVAASSVVYYSLRLCKSGRRSVGNSRVDVHAAGTQLNGHARLTSLDEVDAVNEEGAGRSSPSTTCCPMTWKIRPRKPRASWIGNRSAPGCRNGNE